MKELYMRELLLYKNVSREMLLKNDFKEVTKNRFSISKSLYKSLIILKIEIDLEEKEAIYDIIDRNSQGSYYSFWNNVNGHNNLVALKVINNFQKYIYSLQDRKILRFKRIEYKLISQKGDKEMENEIKYSEKTKEIKIRYFNQDVEKISVNSIGDWIDLRASKDMYINQGEYCLIPLGVAMELPEGYEALIAPRSSTFKKWGLLQTNTPGIIDETYCGDDDQWYMSVYATRDILIHKNDRICQFRIIKHQPAIKFEEVDNLNNTNRGGFGSTGAN